MKTPVRGGVGSLENRYKFNGKVFKQDLNNNKAVVLRPLMFYRVAVFLLKSSFNFLLVSILSISLKMVCLSFSSGC